MRKLRTTFPFPLPKMSRQLAVIWPFLVTVPLLLALAITSVAILAAARTYVEGESLWSKGQKESIYHLMRYLQTHDEADYQRHASALSTPLGDRIMRMELEKPEYDAEIARSGYLQGRNHPAEFTGAVALFRWFRHEPHMDRVIELWTNGDRHVAAIQALAQSMREEIVSGRAHQDRLRLLIDNLHEVNASLTPLTDEFSRTLGDAVRWMQRVLILTMFILTLTLLSVSVAISRRIIRQHEHVESALRDSDARFQLAVAGCNDGIWDWDIARDIFYFSPRLKEMLRLTESSTSSRFEYLVSRAHPDDRPILEGRLSRHLKQGEFFDVEFRVEATGSDAQWLRMRGQSVRDDRGVPVRMAGSVSDITDRKVAEAQLFSEKERAQVTLESIGDAVITTDVSGQVVYVNPVAEMMIGCRADSARGKTWSSLVTLVDEKTRRVSQDIVAAVVRNGRSIEITDSLVLLRKDGKEIAIDQSASPIVDRTGALTGVVLVLHDISRERKFAAELAFLASRDPLTGLINRREFEARLKQTLTRTEDGDQRACVMFLDLDQFKIVNDTNGHSAGDELLRQVSRILEQKIPLGDTLARLGGDEFGILMRKCAAEDAVLLAEEIRAELQDYRFSRDSRTFAIGVSIGLVEIDGTHASIEEVMSAADSACYLAKDRGRNRVLIYRADDADLARRQGEMQWVDHLQRALDENRFEVFAQRIVPLQGVHTQGQHVELLVRLRDNAGEYVPPMAFIPAAERFGMMPMIDRQVIKQALGILSDRRAQGDLSIQTCSINLSGTSIGDERFLDFVCEQLAQHTTEIKTICFEITETAAISNLSRAIRFIETLRTLGCRFSLDDFGAGMASFAYLKQLPVDYLKIDGMFVREMSRDPISRAMVEAINKIGHVMGKTTIAEFVENEDTISELRKIGVDCAQGYGIHRPEPLRNLPMEIPTANRGDNVRDLQTFSIRKKTLLTHAK